MALHKNYGSTMSSNNMVLEIEKAIERLPVEKVKEISIWLDEYQTMLASSEAIFMVYEEEERNGSAGSAR